MTTDLVRGLCVGVAILGFSASCGGEYFWDSQNDDVELKQRHQALTGSGVSVEDTAISYGKYPEVMYLTGHGACTGTVVGPYSILTAHHCSPNSSQRFRARWPSNNMDFYSSKSQTAPYIHEPYRPRWWNALNEAQVNAGGRTDDWPAQHDLRVIFVPSLTPEFLASQLRDNGWRPANLDAHQDVNSQVAVGVASGQSATREFANVSYANAVPNQITSINRDGYFNYAATSTFTSTERGDSGGPALGSHIVPWPVNGSVESGRNVLSTVQGGGYSEAGHSAPLAYDVNNSLTPNQQYTVRLNALWARAAASDADGDGIPYLCDAYPHITVNLGNLCPPPLGSVSLESPRGLLQCPDGYYVTGVRGRAGWYIDELAVRCTPVSCLRGSTTNCNDQHWTDSFSGENPAGSAYDRTCDSGKVVAGVRGRHTAGDSLNDLQLTCYNYRELVDNFTYIGNQSLGVVGNSFGGRTDGQLSGFSVCPNRGAIVGFDVQSNLEDDRLLRWITGLKPVCSGPINESDYMGSDGGKSAHLRCPDGFAGVGFVAAPYLSNPDFVGLLGLLCMDRTAIESNKFPADPELVVAHGSYRGHYSTYPQLVEKYTTFKARHGMGISFREHKCPSEYGVSTARFATNLRGDGKFVNRFHQFTCRNVNSGASATRNMYVGAVGGTYKTLSCANNSSSIVTGLHLDTGWLTDGVGLVCSP